MKVLITTIPFGENNVAPLKMLKKNSIKYVINPFHKKITEIQLKEIIHEYDAIIAGTEPISQAVLKKATKLKLISRVGSGIKNIDIEYAKKNGIKISYTPDAPTNAVSEITIGFVLSLLRNIKSFDTMTHAKTWEKKLTAGIESSIIGILGFGRIGKKVFKLINQFEPKKILIHDPYESKKQSKYKEYFVSFKKLLKESDLITIHVPDTEKTKNMITSKELENMKRGSMIVNTSRGSVINENDLYKALKKQHLKSAALDVFGIEPYDGKLSELENCILTPHISSYTIQARNLMELEAVKEVIRIKKNKRLKSEYFVT